MKTDGIFSPTIQLLERSLDVRSTKHKVISANIANVDTPNYRPFDVLVEEALKKGSARNDGPDDGGIHLIQTDERHFGASDGTGTLPLERREFSVNAQFRMDGNKVDMDQEMVDLSENGILYSASAQIISAKFRGLKEIITSGGTN